jgi:N-glycosylase/DNA lyase
MSAGVGSCGAVGGPVRIACPQFDLAKTLGSGQVFHWIPKGAGYLGLMGQTPVYIEQRGQELRAAGESDQACVAGRLETELLRYFALDHPLEEIYASFPEDPPMSEALESCRGLRIIRQPAWECLATFITSSMKQVAHISQMSHAIRRRFGAPVKFGAGELHAYPSPETLALASEEDLRECKLGFRAKNLLGTARLIAEGQVNLAEIARLGDAEARAALCRLPGVGEKVANCVLLFGFERLQSFPIDVWIERVLRERYFPRKRKLALKRLQKFCAEYFGPYGGYAQQYLFHHARTASS